jgi:hypothetical protein
MQPYYIKIIIDAKYAFYCSLIILISKHFKDWTNLTDETAEFHKDKVQGSAGDLKNYNSTSLN